MGKQFLDDLAEQESGIIVEDGRYKLETEEISEDVSPPGIEPFLWTMRHLKEKGLNKKVKLKAPITGHIAHKIKMLAKCLNMECVCVTDENYVAQ